MTTTVEAGEDSPLLAGPFHQLKYSKAPLPNQASGLSDMLINLLGANPALEVATITFPELYWRKCVGFILGSLDKAARKETQYLERIPPSPQVPSPDNAVATPPTWRYDLRDDKPRGNTAYPWCTLRREMRSPAGEDSGATSTLYALHSRSRYEFSSDTSGLTTLGVYTAPHGRSLADRDAAYIVIPHAPPAPLIGHSDHPVLGLTGASTTSQVDVKCLAKADRGDR